MSKLRVFIAALAAVMLVLVPAAAFAQLMPPCTVTGTAYLDGSAVSSGTVAVNIGGDQVAAPTTEDGEFYVQVTGDHSGEEMAFTVNGADAPETATWEMGITLQQDLHAVRSLDEISGPVGVFLSPEEGVMTTITGQGFTANAGMDITCDGSDLDTLAAGKKLPEEMRETLERAEKALDTAVTEDREEMINLMEGIRDAFHEGDLQKAEELKHELDDILFYLG